MGKDPRRLRTSDLIDPASLLVGSVFHVRFLDLLTACEAPEDFDLIELVWKGYSQEEIAQLYEVDQATISRLLKKLYAKAAR